MSAERLLGRYEQIADAPDAISRLRRFVLDLAVRGKLVPQDPKDETASELLKRIAKEKARIVAEGGFNSLETIDEEGSTTEPFPIPPTWAWCLLDDIAGIARGGSPRPIKAFITEEANGIPWIKIGDSTRGSVYINSTEERIKPEGLSRSRLVVPGDLLLSNSMSFGFPYITNIRGCIHDGWLVIRTPENQISKLYIQRMFLSEYARQAFSQAAAGAVVQNLNADKVRRLPVPIPPLAEQHRIVAKVDELMALCDQLEGARAEREARRDRLTASIFARLNAPDPETFQDDSRFVLNAMPVLTARPDQIKQLRQTILNLAVRGKLVPQNPKEEPASELLKRIAVERARLVSAGEIREAKILKAVAPRAPSNTISGWQVATIEEIVIELQTGPFGSSLHQSDYQVGGVPVVNPASIQNEKIVAIDKMAVGVATLERLSGFKLREGDIVMARRGEMGRCAVVTKREAGWLCGTGSLVLRIPKDVFARFFVLLIGSPYVREYLVGSAVGATMQNLNQRILLNLVVGVPPLAEQRRIVAKVDDLMALCGQLEGSLTDTAGTRARLLDALLAGALDSLEDQAA